MEPRGCNPWQTAANAPAPETAKTSEIRCHRLPETFHGKEAVPGSSPGEGLNTCKWPFFTIAESLLIKEGLANRVGHRRENSQQIAALSDPVEHLPAKEGIGSATAAGGSDSRWKSALFRGALSSPSALGTGFGDRTSSRERWRLRS